MKHSFIRKTVTASAVLCLVVAGGYTSALAALSDTVTVTPQKPSTKDSLHFDLFNATWNCCTQYYQKTVAVSDTMIVLSFQYSDQNLCNCFAAGSRTTFACGPQKAGKYGIYQAPAIYCATPPCPLGVIRMTHVGEVIVADEAKIVPSPAAAHAANVSWKAIGRQICWEGTFNRPGSVSAAIYNARGKLVTRTPMTVFGAGRHGFSWTTAAPGAYFLSVKLNGAPALTRKIVVAR